MDSQFEIKINDRILHDDEEVTPSQLAKIVMVRVETVYRWINHQSMPLPARKETFITGDHKFYIKVSDIKEYFKLRQEMLAE